MERTVTVFHEGAMAYYNVLRCNDGTFKARLLTYNGSRCNTPPPAFDLQKDASGWCQSTNGSSDLMQELGYVIDLQRADFEAPVYALAGGWSERPNAF